MFRSTIGVDVGSTGVRACQVSSSRGRPKITHAAEVKLERGVVVGGEVREVEGLTSALNELWKVGKFSSKSVIVGMAGQQTLVRQVDLPWEPADVFREALPLRVSQDLPVDPMEMTLDYYPLTEFQRGQALMQRALIVAAMNAGVENAADALVAAKLKVTRADFSPFALIRSAVHTAGDGSNVPGAPADGEERPCEVVIDVGGQVTIVAIHDQGRPLFVRLVSAGADSVTRALADHLQIRAETADALKRSLGIQGVGMEQMSPDLAAQIPANAVPVAQQVVNLMAGSLVQVVRESVEYFLAASPNTTGVSRVLLSGGGALLGGYADRVASELRAPVALLAPMNAFAVGRAKKNVALDPRMNLAFGLAMEVR